MAKACGATGSDSAIIWVTTVESTPPDKSDPIGTSLISWRLTAALSSPRKASHHSPSLCGNTAGAKRVVNARIDGSAGSGSSGMRQTCPGGTFQTCRKKVSGAGTKR